MEPLLEVTDLCVEFASDGGVVRAVRGVSFRVVRNETVGIVGESGCGKSVTALSLMRLIPTPPGRITGGSVTFEGAEITSMSERELRAIRGGRISMVFQDPFSCLNPTMTLGSQVIEAVRAHSSLPRSDARARVLELLRSVRLPEPEMRMRQYPHQVSGGQRQRVMVAMAFATDPSLLIADEPTTALDVTVQAQIMALMTDFRKKTNAAVLLITHDLGVVAEMCDRVLVMYAGTIVEEASAAELFTSPKHPYTQGLLESLPQMTGARVRRLPTIQGQPPDLATLGPGCPFAERCRRALGKCHETEPGRAVVAPGHAVRCHLYGDAEPTSAAPS